MVKQLQLKIRYLNYNERMVESFQYYLRKGYFFDVTIICSKHTFRAHKIILSSLSRYFQNLLINDTAADSKIELEDVPSVVMENFLILIYSGRILLNLEHVDTFLEVAEKFQMCDIIDGVQQYRNKKVKVYVSKFCRVSTINVDYDSFMEECKKEQISEQDKSDANVAEDTSTIAKQGQKEQKIVQNKNEKDKVEANVTQIAKETLIIAKQGQEAQKFVETNIGKEKVETNAKQNQEQKIVENNEREKFEANVSQKNEDTAASHNNKIIVENNNENEKVEANVANIAEATTTNYNKDTVIKKDQEKQKNVDKTQKVETNVVQKYEEPITSNNKETIIKQGQEKQKFVGNNKKKEKVRANDAQKYEVTSTNGTKETVVKEFQKEQQIVENNNEKENHEANSTQKDEKTIRGHNKEIILQDDQKIIQNNNEKETGEASVIQKPQETVTSYNKEPVEQELEKIIQNKNEKEKGEANIIHKAEETRKPIVQNNEKVKYKPNVLLKRKEETVIEKGKAEKNSKRPKIVVNPQKKGKQDCGFVDVENKLTASVSNLSIEEKPKTIKRERKPRKFGSRVDRALVRNPYVPLNLTNDIFPLDQHGDSSEDVRAISYSLRSRENSENYGQGSQNTKEDKLKKPENPRKKGTARCLICNKLFLANLMHRHMQIHSLSDLYFTCELCNRTFKSKRTLYSHRYSIHGLLTDGRRRNVQPKD